MPLSPEVADLDAIFDAATELPLRDKPWGRPLLLPPEGRDMPLQCRTPREDGKVPYTRASSMSNYVSDHTALHTWQMRSLTKGLADHEDLAAMAAALPPIIANKRDKKTLTRAEKLQDELTNKRLDEIAEEAMIRSNRDYKAAWGTAVHSFTDPGDHGIIPNRMEPDVQAWQRATIGWEFHATEMFVANDDYQAAGTFDHLVSIPWRPDLGAMVVDKKTGMLHPDQHAVQLSVYANGTPYDVDSDRRYAWPAEPSKKWGIIAHIPLGLGRCDTYLIDLEQGHEACLLACAVRAYRSNRTLHQAIDFTAEMRLHLAGLISEADSRATMEAIHAEHRAFWTDDLTALAKARLSEVAA